MAGLDLWCEGSWLHHDLRSPIGRPTNRGGTKEHVVPGPGGEKGGPELGLKDITRGVLSEDFVLGPVKAVSGPAYRSLGHHVLEWTRHQDHNITLGFNNVATVVESLPTAMHTKHTLIINHQDTLCFWLLKVKLFSCLFGWVGGLEQISRHCLCLCFVV